MLVSVLTDMPGVTAAMWDWWFGWHSEESARYKLWHPEAHQFSTLGENRSADRSLTDRQRYQDNVSYVDEYIGPTLQKLAIWFCKPSSAGFDERPDSTVICARVGSSEIPVAAGWLFHQVRRTDRGAEMRSRFFLGYPEILSLPANAVANPNAARLLTNHLTKPLLRKSVAARVLSGVTDEAGRALFEHCAAEMNHLAHFLPELYTRFGA